MDNKVFSTRKTRKENREAGRSLLFIQPLWLARHWRGASHEFSHPISQNACVLMPILQVRKTRPGKVMWLVLGPRTRERQCLAWASDVSGSQGVVLGHAGGWGYLWWQGDPLEGLSGSTGTSGLGWSQCQISPAVSSFSCIARV